MGIDVMIEGLNHPNPTARIEMLRVLAMVEEVEALPTLRKLMTTETIPAVIEEIKRTGQILWQAQQRGHSTEAGIRAQFRLHLEKSQAELDEEKQMQDYQKQLDAQMIRDKKDPIMGNAASLLALGAATALAGGAAAGSAMIMSTVSQVSMETANQARPKIGAEPISAQRPSSDDITIWLKRLKDADPQKRKAALIELRNLNNPAALPHLAVSFVSDPDPAIREEAQRSGKGIYYNWLYWERTSAAKTQTQSMPPIENSQSTRTTGPDAATRGTSIELPTAAVEPNRQDIADILAKAEAGRKAREAKKRKTQV